MSTSDPLYDEVVASVRRNRTASIAAIKDKYNMGYSRAVRIMNAMEMTGIVSPVHYDGQREVLAPPLIPHLRLIKCTDH